MKAFEPNKHCGNCKGRCCRIMPGIYSPKDFDNLESDLIGLLKTGFFSFDTWEGDPREGKAEFEEVFYFRPSTLECKGGHIDRSWGGRCIFLTESGCCAAIKPWQCKTLEPKEKKCEQHYDKESAVIEWIPFQQNIKNILRSFGYDCL